MGIAARAISVILRLLSALLGIVASYSLVVVQVLGYRLYRRRQVILKSIVFGCLLIAWESVDSQFVQPYPSS